MLRGSGYDICMLTGSESDEELLYVFIVSVRSAGILLEGMDDNGDEGGSGGSCCL
jgi:hypothetical protein